MPTGQNKTIMKLVKLVAIAAITATALSGCSVIQSIFGGGNVFTLKVGDCLISPDNVKVADVQKVSCDEPHDQEVFHDFLLTTDTLPSREEITQEVGVACAGAAFEEYVGVDYDSSALQIFWFNPTEQSWQTGDKLVICMLITPDETGEEIVRTTGSLKDSNK